MWTNAPTGGMELPGFRAGNGHGDGGTGGIAPIEGQVINQSYLYNSTVSPVSGSMPSTVKVGGRPISNGLLA